MLIVAAGSLFVSGLFCTWIALQYLAQPDMTVVHPAPPSEDEAEEEGPRLTRLGRPIEVRRLR
jgi:hypothetical protein